MPLPSDTQVSCSRRISTGARLLAVTLLVTYFSGCKPFAFVHAFRFGTSSSYLESAEELSRQGKTDEAIAQYRAHIDERLAVKDRPEWENPYFYLLLIGDLQLHSGQPDSAIATYEEAEQKEVHASLVSDRYRSVARWYETQGKLQEAAAILQRFRSRDDLLFDSMLDRISKQIVLNEERAAAQPSPAPSVATSPCADCAQPEPPSATLPLVNAVPAADAPAPTQPSAEREEPSSSAP